jgi:hypothetical protein
MPFFQITPTIFLFKEDPRSIRFGDQDFLIFPDGNEVGKEDPARLCMQHAVKSVKIFSIVFVIACLEKKWIEMAMQ